MKKILRLGIAVFIGLPFLFSCEDNETYAKKLERERKAIGRFLNDSGFIVIKKYPEDGVFDSKEFFYDEDTQVYFNVVDSGNGLRATKGREVYVRFSGARSLLREDTVPDSNTGAGYEQAYLNFTYGNSSTYVDYSYKDTYPNYFYKSSGVVLPLRYVGNNAIVRVIVSFNAGSGVQLQSYEPIYIDWLQYNFIKEQGE